jgi:hypothetical protein
MTEGVTGGQGAEVGLYTTGKGRECFAESKLCEAKSYANVETKMGSVLVQLMRDVMEEQGEGPMPIFNL